MKKSGFPMNETGGSPSTYYGSDRGGRRNRGRELLNSARREREEFSALSCPPSLLSLSPLYLSLSLSVSLCFPSVPLR